MRFIPNGPDIPERLVRAHEEGNVIFFCGAGISYPAGLQNFKWLVDQLYTKLHRERTGAEDVAYQQQRFDAALTLLEKDLAGGRATLRTHLPEILKPNTRRRYALDTHKALLTLSRDRNDKIRLITTNFDRLFVKADRRVNHISAPYLPNPKQSRWDGVVYLHGLMDEAPSLENLNRLVLTSGDFGLAYLTERWASRFVSELFAKYTVCFTGYSADDPVLRYMLDALSADASLGEAPIEVFAFAGAEAGAEESVRESWKAKGVTPIIYESDNRHAALHETIRNWAETYRDGLQGRRGIALREARLNPDRLDESGSIGRLLWALNEPSGEVAKAFATAEPVPSIKWLEFFTERRFGRIDLPAFDINSSQIPAPRSGDQDDIAFSFFNHPSAPSYATWTKLVASAPLAVGLDDVSIQLAIWLSRHLDKQETILWVAENGGHLHPYFENVVRRALNESGLCGVHRRIWEVIVGGYATTQRRASSVDDWAFRLQKESPIGLMEKLEFYSLISPRVIFSEPSQFGQSAEEKENTEAEDIPARIADVVNCEITIEGGFSSDVINRQENVSRWSAFLVESLPVFTQILKQCVDLMAMLGKATPTEDLSVWHQPSIASHEQNRRFHAWTMLIELCRDAWDAATKVDVALAQSEFERWRSTDYIVFRRLAMYCAASGRIISTQAALELLWDRDSLWLENCKHEALQLIAYLATRLKREDAGKLLARIMKGPPRKLYRRRLPRKDWKYVVDQSVWIRLTKWRESGGRLPKLYAQHLDKLNLDYPTWHLEQTDRFEFRSWMSSGFGDWRTITPLPRTVRELAAALATRNDSFFSTDDWPAICETDPELAREALKVLVCDEVWPGSVWRDALNGAEPSSNQVITLAGFGQDIASAPDAFFVDTEHTLPWWLRQRAASTFGADATHFLAICRRILGALRDKPLDETDDVVGQAINHPIGRTVEAIIQHWYTTKPQAGQGLAEPYRSLLGQVCSADFEASRPGLALISANLHSLYLADPAWARTTLLPHFDWTHSIAIAAACWEGYLWTPRIDGPLFREMSADFVESARHYAELGKHQTQFASLLVWTAMEVAGDEDAQTLGGALSHLPPAGIAAAADTLSQAVVARKETLGDYLTHRIRRIYPGSWPKSARYRSAEEAKAIALFCVRTGSQFEVWVRESQPFLQAFPDIYLVVRELKESGLCTSHPDSAQAFLLKIVPERPYPTEELRQCLEDIKVSKPKIVNQKRFQRLWEISARPT
jgi:hypothetical protein